MVYGTALECFQRIVIASLSQFKVTQHFFFNLYSRPTFGLVHTDTHARTPSSRSHQTCIIHHTLSSCFILNSINFECAIRKSFSIILMMYSVSSTHRRMNCVVGMDVSAPNHANSLYCSMLKNNLFSTNAILDKRGRHQCHVS